MAKRNSYRFILSVLCICTGHLLSAQTEPEKIKQFNITVNADDQITKTQMLQYNKNISIRNDRTYMWYASQKIQETRGGFAGRLIHGNYRSFYFNGQLKEMGEIRYGLKHNEWKSWTQDGRLKEIIHWRNGVKSGSYQLYNDLGQVIAKGNFKNNKLHGRFYTYSNAGNLVEKKRYRYGSEVLAKVKLPKEQHEPEKPAKPERSKPQKEKQPKPGMAPKDPEKHEKLKEVSWLQRIFKKKKTQTAPVQEPVQERKIINS